MIGSGSFGTIFCLFHPVVLNSIKVLSTLAETSLPENKSPSSLSMLMRNASSFNPKQEHISALLVALVSPSFAGLEWNVITMQSLLIALVHHSMTFWINVMASSI
jgi:hypothetical protein